MIVTGVAHPSRSIEVSPDELEEIAGNSGAPIVLPGARAGWARVTTDVGRYHAWVLEAGVA